MENLFGIKDKVAVVTGGSRGIGRMIASGFVQHGAKVYITARRETELQETARELAQFGQCEAIVSDLSTVEGVTTFAQAIAERESALNILVNNAGATWGADIDDFPESGWDKTMDLNVKALFFLTQQLLPLLRKAATQEDPARIINIGSINGITNPGMTNYAYSASKAAVHHLTRHLAADLAASRINVNGIAPGFFPSKMTAHLLDPGLDLDLAGAIPRGRIGDEQDAAGTAIYLSSRASAWMTGQMLVLDGGQVAQAG